MHSGPIYISYVKAKIYWSDEYLEIDQLLPVVRERTYVRVAVFYVQYYHPFNYVYIAY